MLTHKNPFACLLFVVALLAPVTARAQAGNPQQTLNQYVADLQNNPNDTALREKIIALALTMDPLPEVPAEARRHMARGVAAVEDAKTPGDFKDACNEFQKAATLAPWLANAYRNLAIAQDKAGHYDEALASLRFYLLTKPSSADVDWADDLKSKVEYRKEKAAKAKQEENSPQAAVAREQNSFEALLRKIDGRRYTKVSSTGIGCAADAIDVQGRFLVFPKPRDWEDALPYSSNPEEIRGLVTTDYVSSFVKTTIINDDGDRITIKVAGPGGMRECGFLWQR